MDYKKIANKIRVWYIINIFFLIGFIIAGTRLENYFYETEDYYSNPFLANSELVINEQPNEEFILSDDDYGHEGTSNNIDVIRSIYSYKFTINFYNRLVQNKYKTIISNYNFHLDIISIIQKKNIWHTSSSEEPGN